MNGLKLVLLLCAVLVVALLLRLHERGPIGWPPAPRSLRIPARGERPALALPSMASSPEHVTPQSAIAQLLAGADSTPGPTAYSARRARQKARHGRWVSLTPVVATRSVSLEEDAKIVSYYTVLPNRPVVVRVVGPTVVELRARLDFDPTMRGVQTCDLRLREDGRPFGDAVFMTTKAVAASYTDLRDRVPSKVRHFTCQLGRGVHALEVSLVRPARGSAEVRVSIPKAAASG